MESKLIEIIQTTRIAGDGSQTDPWHTVISFHTKKGIPIFEITTRGKGIITRDEDGVYHPLPIPKKREDR